MSRFGSEGVHDCACGKRHVIGAKRVVLGSGALRECPKLLAKMYGRSPKVWVLSDGNTEQAAGAELKSLLGSARIVSRVLPARPMPVPTLELVHQLSAEAREAGPDLLLSVGSGVVSDLVKKMSLDMGVPNWCAATAASVDAYSSATSAIRVAGYHEALPTGISEVIICDLDVVSKAPRRMFLSGLGDLLAKYIANIDWNLSRLMTGEHYCPMLAEYALGSARKALDAAREDAGDHAGAARSLTDAGLVSGFAMQALGGSRPAASAEHTIAHFWEMAGAVKNEEYDLHGILVGAACRIVLKGYEDYYGRLPGFTPASARRLEDLRKEAPWDETLERGLVPFKAKLEGEMKGRAYDAELLRRRMEAFGKAREEICGIAGPLLGELSAAVDTLTGMDFPFSLDRLEVEKTMRAVPLRNARILRNRYTTFDLAYELGNAEEIAAAMTAAL